MYWIAGAELECVTVDTPRHTSRVFRKGTEVMGEKSDFKYYSDFF
jgi:hypothetical protein